MQILVKIFRTLSWLARAVALSVTLLLPSSLLAQSASVEIYRADYVGGAAATGIGLEYDARPFAQKPRASYLFGAALTYDENGNLWLGAGPVAHFPLGPRWFTDASLMPGFYAASGNNFDLGSVLEFRTTLELGYRINEGTAVSLAVHHLSNADLAPDNPGTNAFGLSLQKNF
jgi:lipid A 3-O-deacylase